MAIKRNTTNTVKEIVKTSEPVVEKKKVVVKKAPAKVVEETKVEAPVTKKIVKKAPAEEAKEVKTAVVKKKKVETTIQRSEKKPLTKKESTNNGRPTRAKPNTFITNEYFAVVLKKKLKAMFKDVDFTSSDCEKIFEAVSDTLLTTFKEGGKTLCDPNGITYKKVRVAPRVTTPPKARGFKNTFVYGYDLLTVRFPMEEIEKINGNVKGNVFIDLDNNKYQLDDLLDDSREEEIITKEIEDEDEVVESDSEENEEDNNENDDENDEEEVDESEDESEEDEDESEEEDTDEEEFEEDEEDDDFELEDEE